jgi:hypothetical protein
LFRVIKARISKVKGFKAKLSRLKTRAVLINQFLS